MGLWKCWKTFFEKAWKIYSPPFIISISTILLDTHRILKWKYREKSIFGFFMLRQSEEIINCLIFKHFRTETIYSFY